MKLKEGSKAPAFKGVDQNGNPISLADFKGKKLVLYFYPHDDTPSCTAQACSLRDGYTDLLRKEYNVVGVSEDTVKKHKKFETKYNLPFPLIADEDHTILKQYGVWGPKTFMGRDFIGTHRTTFLIENGVIRKIIDKPITKTHSEQVIAAWEELKESPKPKKSS